MTGAAGGGLRPHYITPYESRTERLVPPSCTQSCIQGEDAKEHIDSSNILGRECELKSSLVKPSTKRVHSKENSSSQLMTDAVFVAGLTACAYLFAYLFELGYCRHFGIPAYLITITPASVLFSLATVTISLFAVNQVYGFVEFFFKEMGLSRLGFRFLQWVLYCSVNLALFGWTKDFLTGAMLITMMMLASYAALVPNGAEPLLSRIRAAEKTSDPYLKIDPIARGLLKLGRVPILAFNVVILGSVCSYGIGAANARLQTEFVELTTSSNTLAVRAYGELLVSIKFDPATKTATGETLVSKIGDTALSLNVKTKLGPIQRPSALLVR